MGYTHYFHQKRAFTADAWAELLTGMHFLYEHAHESDIKLLSWNGEDGVPEATATEIAFNGAGDESHESLVITRKRPERESWQSASSRGRSFCKTARKPYDVIVTALLAYLDSIHPGTMVVSSDGRTKDWTAGVELARKAWPTKANQIQVPRDVLDTDRYDYYKDSSKLYQVAIDHGGQLWIERHKDRARIRIDADWYEDFMKRLNHSERKYGSFSGDYEKCATRRLNRLWMAVQICLERGIEMPDRFMPLAA